MSMGWCYIVSVKVPLGVCLFAISRCLAIVMTSTRTLIAASCGAGQTP